MPTLAGGATEMGNTACRSWGRIVCLPQPLLLISEVQLSLPALLEPLIHFLSHLQPPQAVSGLRIYVHPESILLWIFSQ